MADDRADNKYIIEKTDISNYLSDPCGTSSLPYWKAKEMVFPDSIRVIHGSRWNGGYKNYQRFFRMKHNLMNIAMTDSDIEKVDMSRIKELVDMINMCYEHENISVTSEEISSMKKHCTYNEELWVCIYACGKMVASGIAEYDNECKEGILEWIQVLPEYRGNGYGAKIVNALLDRLKKLGADFVTVSGNLDNSTSPLNLYKKCGFTGNDIWYICRMETRENGGD